MRGPQASVSGKTEVPGDHEQGYDTNMDLKLYAIHDSRQGEAGPDSHCDEERHREAHGPQKHRSLRVTTLAPQDQGSEPSAPKAHTCNDERDREFVCCHRMAGESCMHTTDEQGIDPAYEIGHPRQHRREEPTPLVALAE